jgi:hypothetical protein
LFENEKNESGYFAQGRLQNILLLKLGIFTGFACGISLKTTLIFGIDYFVGHIIGR